MVAVFEAYVPAQTRPYSYGNNYLKIISRSNEEGQACLRRPDSDSLDSCFIRPIGKRRQASRGAAHLPQLHLPGGRCD